MFVLSSNSLHQNTRLGTGSGDGPSVLMEVARGQHKHHTKQSNNKEENKRLVYNFTLKVKNLQLLQPYAATCEHTKASQS